MGRRFHLYVDDSGSRQPDREPTTRADGMDHFALGGFLIAEDDISLLLRAYDRLISKWQLDSPLHSTRIRGKRGAFAWIAKEPALWNEFLCDLENFLLDLPVIGIACVIDRVGYNNRYYAKYDQRPWLLCRTAYSILMDRAAKFAKRSQSVLEVYIESSGKREDGAIRTYHRELKLSGMPFDRASSSNYSELTCDEFLELLLGEPHFVTKETPMVQIADLYLFAIAKGGYDQSYSPYQSLLRAGKIIDSFLRAEEVPLLGVKYSCFDRKNKGPENRSLYSGLHTQTPGPRPQIK